MKICLTIMIVPILKKVSIQNVAINMFCFSLLSICHTEQNCLMQNTNYIYCNILTLTGTRNGELTGIRSIWQKWSNTLPLPLLQYTALPHQALDSKHVSYLSFSPFNLSGSAAGDGYSRSRKYIMMQFHSFYLFRIHKHKKGNSRNCPFRSLYPV